MALPSALRRLKSYTSQGLDNHHAPSPSLLAEKNWNLLRNSAILEVFLLKILELMMKSLLALHMVAYNIASGPTVAYDWAQKSSCIKL